ncbi:MAG: DUF3873 domain-containing protein [Bacteroides sp.]|nr:DUF3873 domain-containing protein [Bacteroides sp.]
MYYLPANYSNCATCKVGGYCHGQCANYTPEETESITKNGVSTTTEKGQEQYVKCVLGAFRGKEYFQYDYRHTDGELFSTVAETLEKCRERRDEWLNKKA